MKNKKYLINLFISILLITITLFFAIPETDAQTDQDWSEPVNLSLSGASTDPVMVVDSEGVIHIIWIDEFDGYKYTMSEDGVNWKAPQNVDYPFSIEQENQPIFVAGQSQSIYGFWLDDENALYYGKTVSSNLDAPTSWTGIGKLADSVLAFDVQINLQGELHLVYLSNFSEQPDLAGVFYRQWTGTSWLPIQQIYSSSYFRTLTPGDANVHLAVADNIDTKNVYIVWDDRPQKRILLSHSTDGGNLWSTAEQLSGPEDVTGANIPFNVDINVNGDDVLLVWQVGTPGGGCTQYSQQFVGGGDALQQPLKVFDDFSVCPQRVQFVGSSENFSVVMFDSSEDISFTAWNGSAWGAVLPANEISSFLNPVTLDSVILGCQTVSVHNQSLLSVGCDIGKGKDIWFASRPLGALSDWFPTSEQWSSPAVLTSTSEMCQDNGRYISCLQVDVSDLSTVADGENNIHALWIQSSLAEGGNFRSNIQYARWNEETWSSPVTVASGVNDLPLQMATGIELSERLLVVWVDGMSGDMLFSWANSLGANRAFEWENPVYIPSVSQMNSSPDILVDDSGRIVIAYAVPINEDRGIYLVESVDGGQTWSQPIQIFDASAAAWDLVDAPQLALTGDGRLHMLFNQYSLQGRRRQSLGLNYSQSSNGGMTWSEPESVSDQTVVWSKIFSYGQTVVHRLWQEKRQTELVNMHQFSMDGGVSWNVPEVVAVSGKSSSSLVDAVMDGIGNIHFIQVDENDNIIVTNHRWDGSRWAHQEPNKLNVNKQVMPSLLSAEIDLRGKQFLTILVNYQDFSGALKNDIMSTARSLERLGEIPTHQPVLIPTHTGDFMFEEISETPELPTQAPTPVNFNSSPSSLTRYENLVGYFIIGILLVIIIVVFRPPSKWRKLNENKKK